MNAPIYLDFNATTPVAPEVVEAMQPHLFGGFGNPSSSHPYGKEAAEALAVARHQVAALIGANDDEIVFTANATEANNLALLGIAGARAPAGLVVSAVEHPAVIEPARHLRSQGWQLAELPVDEHGTVTLDAAMERIRSGTALVSVMHANNEIGTLQPIRKLAELARAAGALMHTDAAQSVGKVPVDVEALGVDLLSIAGHKFYAPKGVGALYVRRGTPIRNITFGAGQERGLRPGTENVAFAVALGAAAELARRDLDAVEARMRAVRDRLHERLQAQVPGLRLNGHPTERLPNTLNVSFPGVDGSVLLAGCSEIAASTGSACHAHTHEASGVLGAMGRSYEEARGAVRLSVGRATTQQQVDEAAGALTRTWQRLRAAQVDARTLS